MKTRTQLFLGVLALCGVAGLAQASDVNTVEAVPYQYGMRLDIAKVLSMTEPPTRDCEVVTANMRYITHSGEQAEISYQKHAQACMFQN